MKPSEIFYFTPFSCINRFSNIREGECNKCFKDAFVNNMKRGSGPDKEAMKTDMTACADQFLATKYATCNAMMKTEDAEKKEVMECYIKVSGMFPLQIYR